MTHPKDPQAELRETIRENLAEFGTGIQGDSYYIIHKDDISDTDVDEWLALFQAREQDAYKEGYSNGYDDRTLEADHEIEDAKQQLLSELLKKKVLHAVSPGKKEYAIPVLTIERLQNKTNDGGTE